MKAAREPFLTQTCGRIEISSGCRHFMSKLENGHVRRYNANVFRKIRGITVKPDNFGQGMKHR